jgi:acetyl-CoA carboxylase biotin carboxyl carrier protein
MSVEKPASWSDVLALVERLDATDFEDVHVEIPGLSIRVSRNAVLQPSPVAAVAVATAPSKPDVEDPASGVTITAPILGVLYRRPAPDQPPFVEVGSELTPDMTVAIIEVMKLMNPVEAGISGRVAAILAEDGDLVEFGQPLFSVEPNGST